jgi:hypothetical protein
MQQEFNFYITYKDGSAIEGRHVGTITQFMNNCVIPVQDKIEDFSMEVQKEPEPLSDDAFEEMIKQHEEEEKNSEIPEWVFNVCKPNLP